ncbi:MAG: hypothetical protein KDE27_07335, partial [Planctomycetes bacterium]|nr:hypothetical protein [Planctomycetota bacterium]
GDAPTTLRGRLVASDGRTPLAGGTAVVSFGRGRFMTEDPEFRRWPDPIEVRTDGRGVFAVEFVPTRERRVFLEVAAPGHVSASTEWTSLRSGADFDLGDIPLVRGCALGGRVVDQDGRPVVGVTLDIELRAGRFDDGNPLFSGWHSFESTSESDGTLSVQDVPAPGTYAISVASYRTPGWQVLQPQQVEIADERALAPEIVVGRPASEASLGGFLVDERDRPVAGVSVSLAAEFAEWGSAPSGDNGAFWLPWELPHAEHELHLLLGERRYRLLEPAREYARGARDVVVRLVRQPTFDVPIEVVDAQSGVPVESFGLAHVIDYWTEAMQLKIPPDRIYRPVAAAPQPGGRALLRDLPPGDYRLCVWPGVPTFATAYLVPFTVGERGAMPVRVELAGYAPLSVDVRDEAGEPVAGVEVGLIHMMATGGNYSGLFSVEQFARGIGGGRSTAVLLQTVATDATGKVTLRAPIGEPRLGLRVTGPTIGRATHSVDAVPAAGAEFTVTVEARAQVVGRIGPRALLDLIGPDAEARRLAAMVREEDSDLANACPVLWLENAEGSGGGRGVLLPDGSFRIDSAKPGDWQLRLRVDWRMDSGFYSSETLQVGDLAALRAGEVRQVAFEIADFAPARLHGNVTVGGVPAPRGQLGLLARGLDRRLYFHVGIAAGGHYALVLRPGSYLPYVTWREEGGDRYLFADSRCELPPGSDLAVDFAFEHRRLEVNVQHADGTPAAGVRLRWQAVDFPGVNERTGSQCEADDAGVVTFDPAPPGRVQLFVPGDGGALVGEVAAGVGPSSAARVRLPE